MTDEGYLQNKIRELKRDIEIYEKKVEDLKLDFIEMEKLKLDFKQIDSSLKNTLKPFQTFEDNIKIEILDLVSEKLVEFKKQLKGQIDVYLKESTNNLKKMFIDIHKKDMETNMTFYEETIANMHMRIDNLIDILNKRGITNIMPMVFDEERNKIIKGKSIMAAKYGVSNLMRFHESLTNLNNKEVKQNDNNK